MNGKNYLLAVDGLCHLFGCCHLQVVCTHHALDTGSQTFLCLLGYRSGGKMVDISQHGTYDESDSHQYDDHILQ